jgi:hypothetical protein
LKNLWLFCSKLCTITSIGGGGGGIFLEEGKNREKIRNDIP